MSSQQSRGAGSVDIERAVALLRAGELVAFPTETVYGLGADAANAAAVAKIFAAKGRPADHPLIVHLPLHTPFDIWAREVPAAAALLAEVFWPGPLTMILKRSPRVSDLVTGGQDTVGLRVPAHPLARELLVAFGSGIAAPSANRFGRISPTTAAHVRQELGDRVALILDGGPCPVGIESTIVDLTRPVPALLRPGAITAQEIADVLGLPRLMQPVDDGTGPRVSGSLPSHYAPHTPLRLVAAADLPEEIASRLDQGLHVAVLARQARRVFHNRVTWQAIVPDVAGYAHDLYAHLRALDAVEVNLILVEAPPQSDEWLAVNDRLGRAAAGTAEDEET